MQEKLKDPIIKTGLPLIELHSEYDIFIARKITPASVSLQVQLIVHLTAKLFITILQKNNPHAITGRRNIDKHIPNIYLCITHTKMSNYYFPQQKKKYIYIYIYQTTAHFDHFFPTTATQTKQLIQKLS